MQEEQARAREREGEKEGGQYSAIRRQFHSGAATGNLCADHTFCVTPNLTTYALLLSSLLPMLVVLFFWDVIATRHKTSADKTTMDVC